MRKKKLKKTLFNTYLFDKKIFDIYIRQEEKYKHLKNVEDKRDQFLSDIGINPVTFNDKYKWKTPFSEQDYEAFDKFDMILNVQLLIKKLLSNASIDFSPNEIFVIFIMLNLFYEKRGNSISINDFIDSLDDKVYKRDKIISILNELTLPKTNKDTPLFLKKESTDVYYTINLSALIKYTKS